MFLALNRAELLMDRPVHHIKRPWFVTVVTTIGLLSVALAPVAAVGTWLLVTDPTIAGEVAADGSLTPLVTAIAEALGQAVVKLLVYL
jgi:hypothetical protein